MNGNQQQQNHNAKEKVVIIIVNAREVEWDKKDDISYIEVIKLAFGEYVENENVFYDVAYSRAHGDKTGTLTEGESVKVKERMVFNVNKTDKS